MNMKALPRRKISTLERAKYMTRNECRIALDQAQFMIERQDVIERELRARLKQARLELQRIQNRNYFLEISCARGGMPSGVPILHTGRGYSLKKTTEINTNQNSFTAESFSSPKPFEYLGAI